jgi:RNA-binding protein YhbY
MIREQIKLQIGKSGVTEGFLEQLKNILKTHKSVRISMLKSSTRDREQAQEYADKIMAALGKGFRYRLIGYTMVIHRFTSGLNQ